MVELYRFIMPGYNVRPLEMCGAVGLAQLAKLDAMIEQRRENARLFVRLFGSDRRFIIQREQGRSSWFCFTIVLHPDLPIERATVVEALRQAGIGFRMVTGGCFLRHDAIRFFDYDTAGPIVNADIVHDRGFFVGNHPADLTPQITRLREVLDAVCRT
jgi:CDP-6-deoxy-D-xylo-4-hexulose-3-dehydrase